MKRKIVFRKKKQNRLGMFLVMIVVLMLLVVVAIDSRELKETQKVYHDKIDVLEEQIDLQVVRQEELVEYRKYTKTKKYVEEVAKDKLGLMYENEILFKSGE